MCISIKAPAPPPAPEPIPAPPPNTVSGATTKQNAPAMADSTGRDVNVASLTLLSGNKVGIVNFAQSLALAKYVSLVNSNLLY